MVLPSSCSVNSPFTIPFALKISKKISIYKIFKKALTPIQQSPKRTNHTIIAGFGLNGQNIARTLKLLDIPYVIIDINPETIRKYKESIKNKVRAISENNEEIQRLLLDNKRLKAELAEVDIKEVPEITIE